MESKHKNALIGALLAVVFVMAVGYAAFAQQLTINGTAEITSEWDIHFDHTGDTVDGANVNAPACHNGINSGSTCGTKTDATPNNPWGTITYNSDTMATIEVGLVQPGDTVTFTLKPKNFGKGLNATGVMSVLDTDTTAYQGITIPAGSTNTTSSVTATKDHIQFEVEPTFSSRLTPGDYDTIIVRATYLGNQVTNETIPATKAGIKVLIDYSQVA